ncbi:MAG TPA: hypothetical protein PKN70_14025 [Smithellaceae bacterium]|nr:hypothetical protein [Smithellaceae bacterium]
MKKVAVVLLSLGLIVFFSVSVMAVDVKFSGEFYAAGIYQDKTTFKKGTASDGPSTAFYFQRLRLRTDFVVSPGLKLTTRADIMERSWGAQRSNVPFITTNDELSAGTRAENENIAFDLAYISYVSPIGLMTAGYQIDGAWGTIFGNSSQPCGMLTWILPIKNYVFGLEAIKSLENSRSATAPAVTAADRDTNYYYAFAIYNFKSGSTGVLFAYIRDASARAIITEQTGYLANVYALLPYIKLKLGPVDIQAEVNYGWGQGAKWEGEYPFSSLGDTRIDNLGAFLDASAAFGQAYVGGTFAYVSGDDPGTGKIEGGILNGGLDWNPCLILFNADRNYWAGAIPGYAGANGSNMANAWFFQGRAGITPIDKLDVMASVSFANADKKPTANWLYNDYGWEVDLTATYKITNNLTYMLGGAYLFTGKYFKGEGSATAPCDLANNYLIINKLTLTF